MVFLHLPLSRHFVSFILPPFEMGIVKDADCHGMMAAFNGIGGIWCGASKELITNVLGGEWGFHGIIVTDYASANEGYMFIDAGLQAGTDLWLNTDSRMYTKWAMFLIMQSLSQHLETLPMISSTPL